MSERRSWPAPAAGVLGFGSFLLVGWIGLLVPTLIRSIESTFAQSDAGLGVYYFVFAVGYASGSLIGGLATERLGRRVVLPGATVLMGAGLLSLAAAPTWDTFVLAAIPTGLGIGGLDGGVNGLFLDLFRVGRGRALNLLHLSFSLGALSTPLAIGRLIEGGAAWQVLVALTAMVAFAVAGVFVLVPMPGGRHGRDAEDRVPGTDRVAPGRLISVPLVLLAVAIAGGVAAEAGVSNWLVRFLDAAPLSVATTGLTLFWVGLASGRLFSARFADRFDHRRFAVIAAVASAVAVVGAVVAPSEGLSIALFAVTGFGIGPIVPMIMVVAGERYPTRSAAVSGFLSSAALTGTIVYPPAMGFLSVTVGLGVAMVGNGILAMICAVALVMVGRRAASGGAGSRGSPGA
jgi:MFS transporter, FHS family, glucose/mannose:H+ symporter